MVLLWIYAGAILLPILITTFLLHFLTHRYGYWSRQGIPFLKPSIPFGCLGPVLRQKSSFGETLRDIQINSKVPYLGLFFFFRPALLVCDPELVKRILITDFDHFHDRGMYHDVKNDPVAANMFLLPGKQWKDLRAKFSPMFSPGKLKNMFQVITEKSKVLQEQVEVLTRRQEAPLRELFALCNISILCEVFFGFQFNAFENPDHEFVRMGKMFFDTETLRGKFSNAGLFLFPELLKLLKIGILPAAVKETALSLVKHVVATRKSNPATVRNDFFQTIMQLMDSNSPEERLSLELCTAQVYLFYGAGYETSATTASFCLHELSRSPEWMRRAREEVDTLMEKRNGRISFEDLGELKVLEMCIKETMRKYPALPLLNRECTKDYPIPGSDQVIRKGTPIIISIFGLQMDERNFRNPELFDPQRFEGGNDAKLAYYPLGGGPRNCLGRRVKS